VAGSGAPCISQWDTPLHSSVTVAGRPPSARTPGWGGTFGTTDGAGSFAYWTDPVYDTSPTATDTNPNMVYSPVPPATAKKPVSPTTTTPAPWVPFTRAGCNVGAFSTANVELENTSVDIPKVFGANSPEAQQLAADKDSFKDAETADYVGVAVHCAQGSAFCADAKGVKFGQTTATPTAVTDSLPSEPGGYTGYQALFGARYVAPQLGAGTANLTHNGYEVTNAAGNLVDLDGNQINGAFLTNHPGFPGFDPTAPQTLAYAADMLEAGVPVVSPGRHDAADHLMAGHERRGDLALGIPAPVAAADSARLHLKPGARVGQRPGRDLPHLERPRRA